MSNTTMIKRTIRAVVGIDFGTSRSGYAYALVVDERIVPKISWYGQTVPYVKTLTQLLYSSDKREIYWGFQALEVLAEKRQQRTEHNYHFFKNFKMELHESKTRDTDGPYIMRNGVKFSVLDLITDYLRFLKEEALEEIKNATSGYIDPQEIRWCLTVPAIWTDGDKQMMRIAAQRAGLISAADYDQERLLLALEPECAAVYCEKRDNQLKPGEVFMILDCGGGTIDITVHEIVKTQDKTLKLNEVVEGVGGPYGSSKVDESFLAKIFNTRFTESSMRKFMENNPQAYLELQEDWERLKCTCDQKKNWSLSLRPKLYNYLKENCAKAFKNLVSEQNGDDECIYLTVNTVKEIFDPVLDGVVSLVKKQFQNLGKQKCDYIYLVGGFSNSTLLQERIKQEFGDKVKKIIVPPTPGGAVVEGAVYFGLHPEIFLSRVARLTYGCGTTTEFIQGLHPENKKQWYSDLNRNQCEDIFSHFVIAGSKVKIDEVVVKNFNPTSNNQTRVRFTLFATQKKKVSYTDEEGVTQLGEIVLEIPDTTGGTSRDLQLTMFFGLTEIKVEAKDMTSGNIVTTNLQFSTTYSPELIGG